MKFSISTQPPDQIHADVITYFVVEGEKNDQIVHADRALSGIIAQFQKDEEFTGKKETLFTVPTSGKGNSKGIIVAGLGKSDEFNPFSLRNLAALIGKEAKGKKWYTIALVLPPKLPDNRPFKHFSQSLVEGIILGTYVFMKYRDSEAQKKEKPIDELVLVTSKDHEKEVAEGAQQGALFSQATSFARDLVNEPPSHLTPIKLASYAQDLVKNTKSVTCRIYDEKEIEKLQMGAYLAVARGSDDPPRLIELSYKPQNAKRKVVIIGKGITFDTGGLSLKPAKSMESMKMDMAGAAAVLGVFSVLDTLKPDIEVIGLIAATDNMPSARSTKPGDIVKSRSGKYIEILNTDAEGRLTLADMLTFAAEKKPDAIVDLATLTGACMVALGEQIAGLFGNNEELTHIVKKSADMVGEHVWELPLPDEYKDMLKSPVADLCNITKNSYGGAITAALFLQEFIDSQMPWVHLDIAGPAFEEKGTALVPKGGSGFGVRMLLELLSVFD